MQKIIHEVEIAMAKKKIKCEWLDSGGNNCRNYQINETKFCKRHEKYINCAPEEITGIKTCSRCKIQKDCGPYAYCKECKLEVDLLNKKRYANAQKCSGNTQTNTLCTNEVIKDENYCGKHITHAKQLEIAKKNNQKLCASIGHNENCQQFLPLNFEFISCNNCRNKEINRVKNKRNEILEKNKKIINDPINIDKIIMCLTCKKTTFKYGSIITKKGDFSMKCQLCFEKQTKNENNRKK